MQQKNIRFLALALAFVLSTSISAQSKMAPAAAASKIDLNTATEAELDKLPGVGPATAKKIVAGRRYSTVADLSRAGVSKHQIDQITPLVSVSSPATGVSTADHAGRRAIVKCVAWRSPPWNGLGKHGDQGLPSGRRSLVRKDQTRQIHDRIGGHASRV